MWKVSTGVIWIAILGTLAATLCVAAEPAEVQYGLKTQYFKDSWFREKVFERIEPNIECFWDWGSPAESIPVDYFSVQWTGWLRAPKAGRYKLIVHCDDGVIMRVNGLTVIERRDRGVFTEEANVELSETPVSFSLSYFELEQPAFCVMFWQPVGATTYCPVPMEAFFPDQASINLKAEWKPTVKQGLIAEYYDKKMTRRLKIDRAVRTEAIWGDGIPTWGLPADCAVKYGGFLVPEVTGQYTFVCVANDHARLWIDGKPILEAKFGQPKASTAVVDLVANKPVAIRVEYADVAAWGSYSLQWIRPKERQVTSIPASCLFQSKSALPKEPAPAP